MRAEALRLKSLHRGAFWRGIQAGGCGGALKVAAGSIRVPCFRHQAGAKCALAGNSARAARSYKHLHYQQALVACLEKQGLSAMTEYHLGPDGRADLHVIVRTRRHTIKVQLSPIGAGEWQRRDEGYRRQVDHVLIKLRHPPKDRYDRVMRLAQQEIGADEGLGTFAQCVLVSGYDRAGKSTLTSILSDHFDIPSLELGDYVRGRQEVEDALSPHTSTAYEQLKTTHGFEKITQWMLGPRYRRAIFSGVRDAQVLASLQLTYQSTFCIWVESPMAARKRRPRRRGALDLGLAEDDRIQRGWGIDEIKRSSDLIIDNDSSLVSYLSVIATDVIPMVERFLSEELD